MIITVSFTNPFGGGDTLTTTVDDFYLIGTSALIYIHDFDDGTVGEFTVSP